jgi:streptomycin 6-kinase
MQPGTRVEVRSRFDRRWARGFEVDAIVAETDESENYRIKRRSDGAVLPALFVSDEVREEKRGRSMWWM